MQVEEEAILFYAEQSTCKVDEEAMYSMQKNLHASE